MPATVRIPAPLRSLTKGHAEVQATGATVADLVTDLERRFPGLGERLVDESGQVRRFVTIYLNGEDIRFLRGGTTAVTDGDEVSILPAMAGGR